MSGVYIRSSRCSGYPHNALAPGSDFAVTPAGLHRLTDDDWFLPAESIAVIDRELGFPRGLIEPLIDPRIDFADLLAAVSRGCSMYRWLVSQAPWIATAHRFALAYHGAGGRPAGRAQITLASSRRAEGRDRR